MDGTTPYTCARHGAKRLPIIWERVQFVRVDINCQRKWITAPLTLVLDLTKAAVQIFHYPLKCCFFRTFG